ncbi:MAG: hypothetical protein J7647_27565 [Cyanobacteria bacterium SBLK]|nr:hypothetical protein [Cyanobacteria bacterium SBLK]
MPIKTPETIIFPEIPLHEFQGRTGWTLKQINDRVPFWSLDLWEKISAGRRKELPKHRMALGMAMRLYEID